MTRVSWLLASGYFVAHLVTLAPSLEDIDSINFALGLREFDPAQHQPHPPGSPIYIAIGRLALFAVDTAQPALPQATAEALALSLLSATAGALALVFACHLFGLVARDAADRAARRTQLWATILLAVCPLFWLTAVRPMSDMPGLAAALAAQALILGGRVRSGALVAGLAIGIRSQTLWLTAPLMAFKLCQLGGERAWSERARVVLLAAAGALVWAIPLVFATGGLDAYLSALGGQAGEDFAFVDMLWANPTPRRLAFGLVHTLLLPWAAVWLAAAILASALAGAVVMLVRERRALAVLLIAFGPYAAFHLVFQETVTTRYALPVMVPTAFLAARAFAAAGRAANLIATPVAVVSLVGAATGAIAYASGPHPAFRALADVRRRAEVDRPAMVTSHFELRRPIRVADVSSVPVVYAAHQQEWLELVRYWAEGGRERVWFLANPRRADLDLIDPYARRDVVRYRWQVEARGELSGTRPMAVDWYRLRPPGWFLGEGWSLTPETAGLAHATGSGPDRRPITGYLRRQRGPLFGLVGGRHLGTVGSESAAVELSVDGVSLDRWSVSPQDPAFLRSFDLPDGVPAGVGDYALVTIRASGPLAIRQFDVQPSSRPVFGYGPGWHDEELDPATGLRWRWTSDRAVLRVRAAARPVRVRMRGDSPLKYFDRPSTITVWAGGRAIAKLQPAEDWRWDVQVPVDALAAGAGEVVVETNQVFVPSEIHASPDTRRLGLRVFALEVESAR